MTALLLLAVSIGGGAGAVCRYGVGTMIARYHRSAFPVGTVAINLTGSFALGIVAVLLTRLGQPISGQTATWSWLHHPATNKLLTALLSTGFLGGYTTFSTYKLEGTTLYAAGSRRLAIWNLGGSILAGLIAAALGAGLATLMVVRP